jgi:hypothetical protein
LNGAADEDHDGLVKGSELGQYVAVAVPTMMNWADFAQQPIWAARGSSDVILTTRSSVGLVHQYRHVVAVVIAPSSGESRLPVLPKEAHEFADDWVRRNARVMVLVGEAATRAAVDNQFDRLSKEVGTEDLFLLYLVAPASATLDGQVRWWLAGAKESLTSTDINGLVDRIPAHHKALFINSCYAGAVQPAISVRR